MAHCTPHRVGEASATELGMQNAPGKAPVRAQRRIIKQIIQWYLSRTDTVTGTRVRTMQANVATPLHDRCPTTVKNGEGANGLPLGWLQTQYAEDN